MKALIASFFLVFASSANAAVCAKTTELEKRLKEWFNETATYMTVSGSGNILVVYTSPEGSWTVLLRKPDGYSCLVYEERQSA